MNNIDAIKQSIPDFAKDIRLNLDSVLLRSSLTPNDAAGAALAAAFSARNASLIAQIKSSGALSDTEINAALVAASLMGMTNVYYSYIDYAGDAELKGLPAQLRMQAYASHGGATPTQFEIYALAASIVGKCKQCVSSHVDGLRKLGVTSEQLRDIGRIAAVVQAATLVQQSGAGVPISEQALPLAA